MAHIGVKMQPPGYSFETSAYDQFQLIVVQQGRLLYKEKSEVPAPPGTLLVLRKGGRFSLRTTPQEGYRGICWIAQQEELPEFTGPSRVGCADPDLLALAQQIEREVSTPRAHQQLALQGLGQALAALALRWCRDPRPTGDPEAHARYWSDRIADHIEAHLYDPRSVQELLEEESLSYRQLSRYFQAIRGCSPKAYQIGRRLAEAKRLLRGTRTAITSIAYDLGYPSSQHFATQFQKYCGTTPRAYREGPDLNVG